MLSLWVCCVCIVYKMQAKICWTNCCYFFRSFSSSSFFCFFFAECDSARLDVIYTRFSVYSFAVCCVLVFHLVLKYLTMLSCLLPGACVCSFYLSSFIYSVRLPWQVSSKLFSRFCLYLDLLRCSLAQRIRWCCINIVFVRLFSRFFCLVSVFLSPQNRFRERIVFRSCWLCMYPISPGKKPIETNIVCMCTFFWAVKRSCSATKLKRYVNTKRKGKREPHRAVRGIHVFFLLSLNLWAWTRTI